MGWTSIAAVSLASNVNCHATLVAAAFCMFNRYVDGLGADTPEEGDRSYEIGAERLTTQGYVPLK